MKDKLFTNKNLSRIFYYKSIIEKIQIELPKVNPDDSAFNNKFYDKEIS